MKTKIEMKRYNTSRVGIYRIEWNVLKEEKKSRERENKLNQKPPQCLTRAGQDCTRPYRLQHLQSPR
jgi:hypothetical protein